MTNDKIGFLMFDLAGNAYPAIWGIPKEDGEILSEYLRQQIAEPGAHGEEVWVIKVDEQLLLKSGRCKPDKFPVVNQIFRSARKASDLLGYKGNEVSQALSKERDRLEAAAVERSGKDHTESIRPFATLAGVTF
jgi:hypothetical protein